jgi:hypothetical protein
VPGETSKFKIPYALGADKPPSVPVITKAMAEKLEEELGLIAPSQITGVAKKQLLIANASGVVTAVTASGDVTNDEAGVFTIGDGKVSSRKLKPTVGHQNSSTVLTLGETYQDIAGTEVAITPAVASILIVNAHFTFTPEGNPTSPFGQCVGAITVDGTRWPVARYWGGVNTSSATVGGSLLFSLTAAAHTVKLQATRLTAVKASVESGGETGLSYLLVAS